MNEHEVQMNTREQGRKTYHRHISGDKRPCLNIKELLEYRDLIFLLARREFVVNYKQTILGPLWIFLTPIITSLLDIFLFGKVAGISTEGVPGILFYLVSNAVWGFFALSVTACAETFIEHASMLGKVYFPRIVMPAAEILSAFYRLLLQLIPAGLCFAYYLLRGGISTDPSAWWILPLSLLHLGILSLGCGLIVAAMTVKYRDLRVLARFGISLWKYITPVVYPLSVLSGKAAQFVDMNPVTVPVELFRFGLWKMSSVTAVQIAGSWCLSLILLAAGVVLFHKAEGTFIDTI